MKHLFYWTLFFISLCFQGCSNIIFSKLPSGYSTNIAANIKYLGPFLLSKYHSNSIGKVDTLSDPLLKQQLSNLSIEYFQVLYKYDSSFSKAYQVRFINLIKSDSLIILGRFKDMQKSLSTWGATYEVDYFFGKTKPNIKESKDEFHDFAKKINDSIYFIRTNFPNH